MGQDGSGRKSAGLLPQLSSELPITEWLFGLSSLRFLVFPVCIKRTKGFEFSFVVVVVAGFWFFGGGEGKGGT